MANEETLSEEKESTGIRFANDFSEEVKHRIKEEAAKKIEALLEKEELSLGDLSQLAGVSHGSVKGRAKTLASAQEIVVAILDGTRASGGVRKPSVDSIKSFVDSLDADAKAKFLAELGLA